MIGTYCLIIFALIPLSFKINVAISNSCFLLRRPSFSDSFSDFCSLSSSSLSAVCVNSSLLRSLILPNSRERSRSSAVLTCLLLARSVSLFSITSRSFLISFVLTFIFSISFASFSIPSSSSAIVSFRSLIFSNFCQFFLIFPNFA